jgi:glycosyltransferase involved in cell wall biosynthesis
MPFVRYRTGDMGCWASSTSYRLPGFQVLERIEGRLQDFVVCRDHRLISVTTLGAAHFSDLADVESIQYEQHTAGRIVLKVVSNAVLDERKRLAIQLAVKRKTQDGCEVEVLRVPRVEQTLRGKSQLLIQRLDISRFWASGEISAKTPEIREILLPLGTRVLMLSTDPTTRGGIAAVVRTYEAAGLFDRVMIQRVSTHVDGSALRKVFEFVGAIVATVSALLGRRVALVHAHVSFGPSFWRKSLLLALCRIARVPTIFHLHSGGFLSWIKGSSHGPLGRWWIRTTLESSNIVIVLTKSWADRVQEFAPLASIKVVGNPVQIPAVPARFEDKSSFCGPGRVLFLGWIYDFKGCFDLLKAWSIFREEFNGWRLVVGGKGQVKEFLEAAEKLGVRQDLDFLGWVEGKEKDLELRRADIFVLPSYNEGMPVSVLEAMAYEVAVVTTPVGGVPDMMSPDVHGLWVQPGDVQGLCDRMADLARSTELRRRLSKSACEHVHARYRSDLVIDQLVDVYGRLITVGSRD